MSNDHIYWYCTIKHPNLYDLWMGILFSSNFVEVIMTLSIVRMTLIAMSNIVKALVGNSVTLVLITEVVVF